ncbi:rRNA maturation RNase YbeY [Blastomonas sp.]|uniref:rRNA maturation RNase YbeY n=1 Tax=Blastomonas sp. TaxID=1909299 RepID=UPI0035930410
MIDTEVSTASEWPADTDWQALVSNAVTAALGVSPQGSLVTAPFAVSVSVHLGSDAEVQALNRDYRDKDQPTNVLSFPMVDLDLLPALANTDAKNGGGEVLLGDIMLAYETCAREAADKSIALADHAVHLTIHGTLHLVGYDHGNDAEAEHMEALEVKALAKLGIDNPY